MTVKYEKFLLNGVEYKTQLTQKWVNRKKWEEPNPYLLTSHIPGTIMQIEVKEGQEVQEGDVLLILQAMKMNNKLAAPFSGKIKKIYVNSGDKIPKGTNHVVLTNTRILLLGKSNLLSPNVTGAHEQNMYLTLLLSHFPTLQ